MERLLRTTVVLQDCERHLKENGAFGTEIEAYLTQYLLIVLCAEIQQEIYILSEERAALANDPPLSHFIAATSRKTLRSVKKGEIAGFLEQFGPGCKAKLDSQLDDAEVTVYNNAVNSRHDVAHKQGSTISFRELESAVKIAAKLLAAAAAAIEPTKPSADGT